MLKYLLHYKPFTEKFSKANQNMRHVSVLSQALLLLSTNSVIKGIMMHLKTFRTLLLYHLIFQ